MTTTVNTFAALRATHTTWEALKSHLTSEEGGKLRVVENGSRYAVIRYVKGAGPLGAAASAALAGHFRSVVWDTIAHVPVCVAPFKAEEGLPPLNVEGTVSEFLDGFMVNAFVTSDGVLEVATRTCIGGGNTFYSQKTFGQMFDESLANSSYKDRAGVVALVGGAGGFASFLVQHPEHRIVAKVARAATHVIHTGRVDAEGVVTLVRPDAPPHAFKKLYATEKEIEETMRRMGVQMGWRWQGLCFHDAEGRRWRIRSPTYTLLRELRGAEAGGLERFLRLRAEKRVGEYLKHYSEDRTAFWGFEQKLRAVTGGVLAAYNDCHKAHAVAFKDLPDTVKPAVYMLHVKWLQELRPKGYVVRLQNVIEVVNGLRAFEQRRLIEGEVYVAAAPAAKPTEGQGEAAAAEEPSKAEAAEAGDAPAEV